MEYIIEACGIKFLTKNEFAYEKAMSLNDGETVSQSERMKFIIRLSEDIFRKVNTKKKKVVKTDNTIASLYPLAKEMHKSFLTDEDEEWLNDILGPDPYIPLY